MVHVFVWVIWNKPPGIWNGMVCGFGVVISVCYMNDGRGGHGPQTIRVGSTQELHQRKYVRTAEVGVPRKVPDLELHEGVVGDELDVQPVCCMVIDD